MATSLGQLSVQIKADTALLKTGLEKAAKMIRTFSKETGIAASTLNKIGAKGGLGKLTSGIKGATVPIQRLQAEIDRLRKQQMLLDAQGHKTSISVRHLGEGLYKVGLSARVAGMQTKMMGEEMQRGAQRGISGLLSLRSMVGKIVHYITFSIGVQLVMGVRQGFMDMIETFKEFERAITDAVAISGYLGSGFDQARLKVSKLAKEISEETVFSMNEAAKAFYDLASAGYDVTEMTKRELIPIFEYAAATQSDLKEATQSVMATLKAFKMDLEDTQMVVDTFTAAITSSFLTMEKLKEAMKYVGPIAGTLGIGLDETVAAVATLADVGMEGGQSGQRLNMVLTKLLKPTEKAKQMLEGVGLTMRDLDPEVYSLTEILYKLQGAGVGAAEMATMFRARTAGAATVLIENADAVARLAMEYKMATGITHDVAEAQETTLWASLKKTADTLGEIAINIGNQLAPALEGLVTSIMSVFQPAMEGFGETFSVIFQGLADTFNEIKPVLQGVVSLFLGLLKAISPLLGVMRILLPIMISYYAITKGMKVAMWALAKAMVLYYKISKPLISFYKLLQYYGLSNIGMMMKQRMQTIAAAVADLKAAAAKKIHAGATLTLAAATKKLSLAILASPIGIFAVAFGALATAIWLSTGKAKEHAEVIDRTTYAYKRMESELTGTQKEIYDAWKDAPELDIRPWGKTGLHATDEIKRLHDVTTYMWKQMQESPKEYMDIIEEIAKETEMSVDFTMKILRNATAGHPIGRWETMFETALENIVKDGKATSEALVKQYQPLEDAINHLSGEYIAFQRVTENAVESNRELVISEMALAIATGEYIEILEDDIEMLELKEIAQARVNDLMAAGKTDMQIITEISDQYVTARERAAKADEAWLGTINLMISEIRAFSDVTHEGGGTLDQWIGTLEDATKAEAEWESKGKARERLMIDQENAVLELSKALASYGAGSKEAIAAQDRLNDVLSSASTLEMEIADLYSEKERQRDLVQAAINNQVDSENELSEVERNLLEDARSLVDMRNEYIRTQTEEMKISAQLQALNYARENHVVIMEEKLRLFLEAQQKIFDIEEKLYKLRVSEDEQMEDLFNKLAEQGLLTDEMIQLYTDLAKAQGEVAKLQFSFAQAYEDLTPEQEKLVNAFMATEAGTQEYEDALQALRDAGIENIGIFIQYNDAQDNLTKATDAFSESVIPFVDNLKEIGAISAEVAAAFYDIIDNANELAKANFDLASNQAAVNDTMDGMINTTTMLAKSLMGYGENADTLAGIYPELLDMMGISRQEAVASLGPLEDLSEEQMIVGATLIQIAKSIGIYEEGMDSMTIANKLGLDSISGLNNMATVSLSSMDSYAEVSETLASASQAFKDASDALSDSLNKLWVFMGLGTKEMADFAANFDFADTLVHGFDGNIRNMFQYLESRGWDWDIDMMTNWDGEDWNAFISNLDSTQKSSFIGAISEMSGESIDTITKWDGEDWTSFMSSKQADLDRLQEAFINAKIYIPVEFRYKSSGINFLSKIFERLGVEEPKILKMFKKARGYQRGLITDQPTMGVFGEAGREALIPLEGANKKYGRAILENILPRYFPNLMMQRGGIVGKPIGGGIGEPREIKMPVMLDIHRTLIGIETKINKLLIGLLDFKDAFIKQLPMPGLIGGPYLPAPGAGEIETGDLIDAKDDLIKETGQVSSLVSVLNSLFETIKTGFTDLSNIIVNTSSQFDATMATTAIALRDSIINVFGELAESIRGIHLDARSSLGDWFMNSLPYIIKSQSIDPFVSEVSWAGTDAGSKIRAAGDYFIKEIYKLKWGPPRIEEHQRGLIANQPTMGIFGERGAEALVPLEGINKRYGREIVKKIIPILFPDMPQFQEGGIFGGGDATMGWFPTIPNPWAGFDFSALFRPASPINKMREIVKKEKQYNFMKNLTETLTPKYSKDIENIFENANLSVSKEAGGETIIENYNITGPINITGVQNTTDIMSQLKMRARSSKRY